MKRLALLVIFAVTQPAAGAEDPVFSGPQPGELLTKFTVRGVYDEAEAKELDFVASAKGKPLLLVFVHEVTRPSVALTRILMDYAAKRHEDGLRSAVVFLTDDATETTAFLKRARHAMPKDTPIGISVDGREGPGAYGLNRNVALTVLVGKEDRVRANFALVQPSVQADAPRILEEVVKLVGGKPPTLEQLEAGRYDRAMPNAERGPDPKLRELLQPVIRKDAMPEGVDRAAEKVVAYMKENRKARQEVAAIARRIIAAGKLENYGTARAQEHLRRWAEQDTAANEEPRSKAGNER